MSVPALPHIPYIQYGSQYPGNAGRAASHCGHCTPGHQGAALVPPVATLLPAPGRGIALAVPCDGAAAGLDAATPYHTRAPPLSV